LQRAFLTPFHLLASVVAVTLLEATANATDESMATLADGQGPVEIFNNGEVVGTVKAGEHFLVMPILSGWNVYLKSGFDGFIDKVQLRLLPDEPLMKLNYAGQKKRWQNLQSAPDSKMSDTASSAKGRGVNYFKTLVQASDGNMKAMARFFSLSSFMDGAAAEGYYPDHWVLLHVAGDETFANSLRHQPATLREKIGGTLSSPYDTEPISNPKPYLKQYFPKSYQILFGKEQ
jgi:hypothetical protein